MRGICERCEKRTNKGYTLCAQCKRYNNVCPDCGIKIKVESNFCASCAQIRVLKKNPDAKRSFLKNGENTWFKNIIP